MKNYSDNDLIKVMGTASIQNEVIDTRIAETLEKIRQGKVKASRPEKNTDRQQTASARKKQINRKKHTAWKKIAYGMGTVVAAMVVAFGICVANPSLAADIPILGNIFAKVQDVFPFGRVPEDETTKLYDENAELLQNVEDNPYLMIGSDLEGTMMESEETEEGAFGESTGDEAFTYRAEDDGITLTFTEYYASNQAIFIGVCIESQEPFPTFATMGDTDYQLIQANTEEQYSFRDTVVDGFRNIEGRLEDVYTFAGIMRIDYDSINVDDTKYETACKEAEEKGEELPAVTDETWDLYMERYEVPEEFEVQIKVESLRGYCKEAIDAENGNKYMMRGNWDFPSFTIGKSDKDVRTIQIGEVNEQGIGLDRIEISPVELTLHTVEPASRLTFAAVLDKDSKRLSSGSSNAYELAIVGHDISAVTVYICDYDEYMDEIKAYALEDDEKFREVLEEKALFKAVVDTRKN